MPDFIGGPERTRTSNQTVMSAVPYRKDQINSVLFLSDRMRSCAFLHGVSVGFLWDSLPRLSI